MKRFIVYSKRNTVKSITTASLPDVVFMLLFFFMVTTIMRETEIKVSQQLPAANQIKRLKDKSLVTYVYVGTPLNTNKYGQLPRIQLNDSYVELSVVGENIAQVIGAYNERERSKSTISLKVDSNTEMGIISDLKQELRRVNALKICYSTKSGKIIN